MARVIGIGRASRLLAVGLVPAACLGYAFPQRPLRCDAFPSPSKRSESSISGQTLGDFQRSDHVVRQISSGSLAGFGTGLVVALFSRTLVIISGLCALTLHVACRFGLDISRGIGLKDRVMRSPIWKKSIGNPWFSGMFSLTFTLAAFVHL